MYPITLIVILIHISVSNQHTVHLKFTWCSSLVAQMVKRLPTMRKTQVQSLGREDPWRSKWQPTPKMCLLGCILPRGFRESLFSSLFQLLEATLLSSWPLSPSSMHVNLIFVLCFHYILSDSNFTAVLFY